MSRERVLGQQVQVFIYTNDAQKPLIVNFDAVNDEKIIENRSYKGVGKKFSRKHNISNGYTINLKREKTDHYIQEILKMMDALSESGQQHLELMVKKVTEHAVTLDTINPSEEFRIVDATSENPSVLSLLNGTVKRGLTGLASQTIANLDSTQRGVLNAVQTAIRTQEILSRLFAVRYIEEEIYKNCSVAGYNSSTNSREDTTIENLTLESTNRTFIVPDNKYSRYFQPAIIESFQRGFENEIISLDAIYNLNEFVDTENRARIRNISVNSLQSIVDDLNRLND